MFERMYAMLAAGVPLVPGILAVLDRLDRAGIPYAMGSNGSLEKMRITLGQHGIEGRSGRCCRGRGWARRSPRRNVYLAAARACGVAPEGCVVIEDSARRGRVLPPGSGCWALRRMARTRGRGAAW